MKLSPKTIQHCIFLQGRRYCLHVCLYQGNRPIKSDNMPNFQPLINPSLSHKTFRFIISNILNDHKYMLVNFHYHITSLSSVIKKGTFQSTLLLSDNKQPINMAILRMTRVTTLPKHYRSCCMWLFEGLLVNMGFFSFGLVVLAYSTSSSKVKIKASPP